MAFKDYDDFPPPKPIEIPISGKLYIFPGTISARSWLLLQRLNSFQAKVALAQLRGEDYDPEQEVLSDLEFIDVRGEVFGDTEETLVADGVTSGCMQRLFMTLVAYHLSGQEAAERVWNQGERLAPNRAMRRAAAQRSTRARGSHAGSTASRPARAGTASSTAGNSSRPTSKSTTT